MINPILWTGPVAVDDGVGPYLVEVGERGVVQVGCGLLGGAVEVRDVGGGVQGGGGVRAVHVAGLGAFEAVRNQPHFLRVRFEVVDFADQGVEFVSVFIQVG